ncbi:biliverdin-producing heme oxygenase [Celeribacter indicus]|uniref:Heme oxygenase-like protein n=1 Tax=Celeribacter indicus TaxID=1208324 RepID=A0A0B5DYL1_9RHOB|nr:biliverdin-producing heme oxygenase [Celeribacter indicus]AJE45811.1 heme oxygenase-like protein [Celeribacter indicus]SDW61242.1 heme oxygenase [Celeribacter indicus]
MTDTTATLALPLSKRLKAETRDTHERLDRRIMDANPFDSLGNYRRFLKMQHDLHRDVSPLYDMPALGEIIPGLSALPRYEAVARDLADLGGDGPVSGASPAATRISDPAEALGWLYVVEGSNLGAAFLFKAAQRLGLSETRGARHLAPAPEGRAEHWRQFTSALDAAALSEAEKDRAVAGARAAFARAGELVRSHLG